MAHHTAPHRRFAAPVLGPILALALLTGCGGDDGEPPADEPTTIEMTADDATPEPTGSPTDAGETAEDDAATDSPDATAEEVVITISDFAYDVSGPVTPGAEITVTNEDSVGHTVTSDDDGLFDVAVDPGATVTFTAPDEPGEYGFFCIPHPHMTGTLVVG